MDPRVDFKTQRRNPAYLKWMQVRVYLLEEAAADCSYPTALSQPACLLWLADRAVWTMWSDPEIAPRPRCRLAPAGCISCGTPGRGRC